MDAAATPFDDMPQAQLNRANGPLYRQLADVIRRPIESGRFVIGSELPKEALIAEHFGVSLITVRQALRNLEADGLIEKRSAKPALVIANSATRASSWSFQNFADMAAFTQDARLLVQSYGTASSPVFARHFGLPDGAQGYCLRAILAIGAQRRTQITSYFPPAVGVRLARADFSDALIFQSVQRVLGVRLEVAHLTVRAEVADPRAAADLEVGVGSALLTVEMAYQTKDQQTLEFTVARHPAHLFSIRYDAPNDIA